MDKTLSDCGIVYLSKKRMKREIEAAVCRRDEKKKVQCKKRGEEAEPGLLVRWCRGGPVLLVCGNITHIPDQGWPGMNQNEHTGARKKNQLAATGTAPEGGISTPDPRQEGTSTTRRSPGAT